MRVLSASETADHRERILALLTPCENEARGEFTIADLLDKPGSVFFALGDDICVAFEFRHYPRLSAVHMIAIGGAGLHELADKHLPAFKQWAAQAGIARIQCLCPKWMARMLKSHGFTNDYEQVSLAVEEYPC